MKVKLNSLGILNDEDNPFKNFELGNDEKQKRQMSITLQRIMAKSETIADIKKKSYFEDSVKREIKKFTIPYDLSPP